MEFPSALLGVASAQCSCRRSRRLHADAKRRALLVAAGLGTAPRVHARAAGGRRAVGARRSRSCRRSTSTAASPVNDVLQTRDALLGYSVGLLGLIVVKILAPGFYARQAMATPVKIAFATVLVSQIAGADPDVSGSDTRASRCRRRSALASTRDSCSGSCARRGIYTPRRGLAALRREARRRVVRARRGAALARRPDVVLARARRSGRRSAGWPVVCARGRRRLLRRAVAARFSLRRLQPPGRHRRGRRPPRRTSTQPALVSRSSSALRYGTARLHAFGVEVERVPGDLETALARHRILPLLDGGVVELLDAAALAGRRGGRDDGLRSVRTPPCRSRNDGAMRRPACSNCVSTAVNGGEADVGPVRQELR